MKKLVFALCMFFGGVVVVNAQDTTSTPSPTDPTVTEQQQPSQASTTSQEDGRVKIKSQDLPDAVKSSLEGQEFRGWLVNSAYKVDGSAQSGSSTSESDSTSVSATPTQDENAGGKELYIVELKNGAQTKTVKFDKDGKKLEDAGMQDDQE